MDVSTGTSNQLLQCGTGPDACGSPGRRTVRRLAVTHGTVLELIDPVAGEATVLQDFRGKDGRFTRRGPRTPPGSQSRWPTASSRRSIATAPPEPHSAACRTSVVRSGRLTDRRSPTSPGPRLSAPKRRPMSVPDSTTSRSCCFGWRPTRPSHSARAVAACASAYPSLGWSPDGTRLALVLPPLRGGPSGDFGLFVMNADGSDLRLLSAGWASSLAWQPVS